MSKIFHHPCLDTSDIWFKKQVLYSELSDWQQALERQKKQKEPTEQFHADISN